MTAVGVDIGGTNTKIGLVDSYRGCYQSRSFKTQDFSNANDYLNCLISGIENLLNGNGIKDIHGIGIGAPGVDDRSSTIIASENIKWLVRYPLKQHIQEHFNVSVDLINDANASAIGEMTFGVAKEFKNFLHLTLGTGLGGCIVADGRLIRGFNGMAGEIGHANAISSGRPCNCGKSGCLENYVSASGLRKTALEFLEATSIETTLREISSEKLSARDITLAAGNGDSLALEVFQFTGTLFGKKLAEIVSVLDPEAIILAGGMAASGDLLMNPTRKSLYDSLPDFYESRVKLISSSLDQANAAVLGAAAHFISSN